MATYNILNFINEPSPGDRLMFIYNVTGKLIMAIDPYSSTFINKSKYIYIISDGKMNYDNVLDFSSNIESEQALSILNDIKKIFIDRTNNILNNCGGVVTISEFNSHTANTNFHITENERLSLNESNNPSSTNPFATILDIDIIGSGDTKQVKVSGGDDISGYLIDKISGSTYIKLDILNSNSAETLQISTNNLISVQSFYDHTGNTQHLTTDWYNALLNSNTAPTLINPIATIADIQASTTGLTIPIADARYIKQTGDTMIGDLLMDADIIPVSDGVRNLGSSSYQWKELWVSGGTIYFDRIPLSTDGTNLLFNGSTISYISDLVSYYTQTEINNNFLSSNTSFYTQTEVNNNFLSSNTNLNDLNNVNTIGILDGYYLSYSGGTWIGKDLSNYYTKQESETKFLNKNIFNYTDLNVSIHAIDWFPMTLSDACHWQYTIKNDNNIESGTIVSVWNSNSSITHTQYSVDVLGSNNGILFDVEIVSGVVRLIVNITSGTWDIKIRRFNFID